MGEVSPRDVSPRDVYTAREIALAAGVAEADVAAALGRDAPSYVTHDEAVRLGRLLRARATAAARRPDLFAVFTPPARRAGDSPVGVPLAVSSGAHAVALAIVVWLTSVGLAPSTIVDSARPSPQTVQLVFLQEPGPGGGGGGGGRKDPVPATMAMRLGNTPVSSPVPPRERPAPVAPPTRQAPPLDAEPLPAVVAPVAPAAADRREKPGGVNGPPTSAESQGPGMIGGAGSGTGTGVGEGVGPGIGAGSGGGTGGGPYRPGSGIVAPRLVREIKADYTEDARRRSLEGEVVLEIVVRRDGSVGPIRVKHGLGSGLDDRAVDAVRQWQFAPATRLGSPVDVMVEVSVEFRLR